MNQEKHNQTNSTPKEENKASTSAYIISAVSVTLSLLAVVVSIRSCSISERAIHLSSQDFVASRSVIYKGVVNEKNDELLLSAIDSDIQIQCAAIYLPPQLNNTTWNISPPNYAFPLAMMRRHICDLLDKYVVREKGYYKIIEHTSVPLIIASSYIAKGQSYSEMSLYLLVYTALVPDENYEIATIKFKGLIFKERLKMDTKPHTYLDALWETTPINR
jgi:hypothetical protein